MRRDGFHSFIFKKMKENAEMIFDSSQREEREHRAQTTETSSFEFEVAFTSISRKLLFFFCLFVFSYPEFLGNKSQRSLRAQIPCSS